MKTRLPGKLLARSFFAGAVEHVAPQLLGKLLVRRTRAGVLAGRIVELEAYLGPHHETPDRASHSHRGPTPRNQVMFGPPGHAYVYFIYGTHYCMNITCEPTGRAGCILLRALEPVTGLAAMAKNRGLAPLTRTARKARGNRRANAEMSTNISSRAEDSKARAIEKELQALASGPGRLCEALDITRERDNGVDLLDARSSLQVRDDGFRAERVHATVRIGITHAAELPLRFCLDGHGCVSGPKSLRGQIVVPR